LKRSRADSMAASCSSSFEAALRHAELLGQAADGQAFQALQRRQVDRMAEDALLRPIALHA
jgi:hypothetical protein